MNTNDPGSVLEEIFVSNSHKSLFSEFSRMKLIYVQYLLRNGWFVLRNTMGLRALEKDNISMHEISGLSEPIVFRFFF